MIKKALHFGAGSIGRGFIGKLLYDSGINVTFADIDLKTIAKLNDHHKYYVNIVGKEQQQHIVKDISAINSTSPETAQLISHVDLITTSVGPRVLPIIAPILSKGLQERKRLNIDYPLNIIACENMINATSKLKEEVYSHLEAQDLPWVNKYVGFADSAIDRLVPPILDQSVTDLVVNVEPFYEWIINKSQFIGSIPNLQDVKFVDDLMPYIERKLFTVNTGHAITAYLGQHYGLLTIEQAINEPKIRDVVYGAMQESGQVLIRRYGFNSDDHENYIQKIINRFENPYLHDDTERVAREPIRKLGPKERLIKPLLGTIEYNLTNNNLLIGVAAALAYHNDNEKDTKIISDMIQNLGFSQAVTNLTSIENQLVLIEKINTYYCDIKTQFVKIK